MCVETTVRLILKYFRGINPHQFYEFDSIKCLTFNAGGLRVDEIGSIGKQNYQNLH